MIISFAVLLISFGYICYQTKDEVLIEEECLSEKDDIYKGLDDLFI